MLMVGTTVSFVHRAAAVGVAAVVLCVSVATQSKPPRAAGAAPLPGAEAVRAFTASRTAPNWKAPRTPWGDPDLQGIFTSKDEANTPFQRPAKWTGRRMEDITAAELAADVVERQQRALEQAPFAGGGEPEDGVAIAVPIHWFDSLTANNSRPWHVIDPADGTIPALVPSASSRAMPRRGPNGGARDSYTDRVPADRCITQTWRGPGLYGNSFQILQTAGYVVFRREQIHEARIFPLDGGPHLAANVRPYQGDGRAHWDGNTLVVEVTNFNENQDFRGYRVANLRLIERFTRIAPNTVEWSVTVDDPTIWSRPWIYSIPLTQDSTQMIHEYACHEGNYGLANILSAGRAAEARPPRDKER
jgi:hypothetical protein